MAVKWIDGGNRINGKYSPFLDRPYPRNPILSSSIRKEVLEAELQKVEKAMDKLSKPTVLVYDDIAL